MLLPCWVRGRAWGQVYPAMIRYAAGMSLAISHKTPCFQAESVAHPRWRRVRWDKRMSKPAAVSEGQAFRE